MQTPDGPQHIGRFELGSDREAVCLLFKKLKGMPEINDRDRLYMELTGPVNEQLLAIDMLSCDLQELGTNCMLITQELFGLMKLK